MGELIFPDLHAFGDGNWRRMLLTQPATTSLSISAVFATEHHLICPTEPVVNAEGITVSDCIKKLEDTHRDHFEEFNAGREEFKAFRASIVRKCPLPPWIDCNSILEATMA